MNNKQENQSLIEFNNKTNVTCKMLHEQLPNKKNLLNTCSEMYKVS